MACYRLAPSDTGISQKAFAARQAVFLELRRGLALGYRRGTEGGSWLLREYRGDRYVQRRLGAADDETPADGAAVLSWSQAQAMALGAERPTVTHPARYTVDQAAEDYFAIRAKKSSIIGDQLTYKASIRAQRQGIPRLGNRPVCELTTGELKRWLAALIPETLDREERRRAQATANRHWNLLRAILNSAYENEPDRVPSADAWRRIKPYENVDRPRTRVITVTEARVLVKVLKPELRALAQASLYTGLRLGELLALKNEDLERGAICVRHSKSGRSRSVPLTDEGVLFFTTAAAGRAKGGPMFEPLSRIKIVCRAACERLVPPRTSLLRLPSTTYGEVMAVSCSTAALPRMRFRICLDMQTCA